VLCVFFSYLLKDKKKKWQHMLDVVQVCSWNELYFYTLKEFDGKNLGRLTFLMVVLCVVVCVVVV